MLEAITAEVLASLIITSVTTMGRTRRANKLARSQSYDPVIQALSRNIQPALRDFLADAPKLAIPDNDITLIAHYLRSMEGRAAFRAFAIATLTDNVIAYEDGLQSFMRGGLHTIGFTYSDAEAYAEMLFPFMVEVLDRSRSTLASDKIGFDVRASAIHYDIAGTLDGLMSCAAVLEKVDPLKLDSYLKYLKKYKMLVVDRNDKITPPNFASRRTYPLNDLYITPTLRSAAGRLDASNNDIEPTFTFDIDALKADLYRDVVLGDPGAGKSTLCKRLVLDLYRDPDYADYYIAVVILKDFRAGPQSIVEYLENESRVSYQLPTPDGAVQYFLSSGRACVIFDGLDELLEVANREKIRDIVDSFGRLYPQTKILVTSRRIGYSQAPLPTDTYGEVQIDPLTDDQIREYAVRWFNILGEDSPLTADTFLEELKLASEIAKNPLILSLLATLYIGAGYIPRNLADVYEKCAELLYERWDRMRAIYSPEFSWEAKFALCHVAYWMYTSTRQRGVTRTELEREIASYLEAEEGYRSTSEAMQAATAFIETWKGRSWILTDVGATVDEELYDFTHQTFLEYFTSMYIVRTHPTAQSLWQHLRNRIIAQEWYVICIISVQRLNRQIRNGGNDFVRLALDYVDSDESSDATTRQMLTFLIDLFDAVSVKWVILQRLTVTAFKFALITSLDELSRTSEGIEVGAWQRLLSAGGQWRPTIREGLMIHARTIVTTYRTLTSRPNEEREMLRAAVQWITSIGAASKTSDDAVYWLDVGRDFARWLVSEHGDLVEQDVDVANACHRVGVLELEDLTHLHGALALLRVRGLAYGLTHGPLAYEAAFSNHLDDADVEMVAEAFAMCLRDTAARLHKYWLRKEAFTLLQNQTVLDDMNSAKKFIAFALVAIAREMGWTWISLAHASEIAAVVRSAISDPSSSHQDYFSAMTKDYASLVDRWRSGTAQFIDMGSSNPKADFN